MPTIDHCIGCPYREFGPAIGTRGDRTSRMVLVGEAPGAKEVDQETPFFGSAGDVLWTALAEAGLREADVFVVNSVACRPFNSVAPIRRPSPDAIDACNGRLLRDIAAYPRAVIVALGATAVQAVTGQRGFLVTKKKPGTDLPSDYGTVVPTLHPAFVRRRGLEGPEYQMLVADLRHARRLASGTGSERVEMKVHNIPKFRLRCPLSEVMYWAARYAYADDSEVEAIGERARKRGWYTRDEFLAVARWKSPRSRRRCEENDEATVKAATQLALSTADERQRIEALTQLHGIDYPTASVLLHLAHRDPYPIIDFRALWSLGVESPPAAYSFTFWWAYTQACRLLAKDAGVRMRTLDRALWQYSKERRPPTRTSAAEPGDAPKTPAPGETGVSKSEVMRRMYAEGSTVVEVAKALNVDYSFAYGVRKRWLDAQTEPSGQRSSGDGVPGRVGGAVGKRVLGIDGAEGGWFAALLVDGYFAGAAFQPTVSALIRQFAGVNAIAIDIPIGLPVGQFRPADAAARAFVGPERAASVFPTPPAEVLAARTYAEANEISRRLVGTGISQQTWALRGRIFEVAEVAASDDRIIEVHPEVSFRALNGRPVRYSKHSWSGIAQRRSRLAGAGILLPDEPPDGGRVDPDDVVDAAVAAWSALRVAMGRSATLPAAPSGDTADGGVIHY